MAIVGAGFFCIRHAWNALTNFKFLRLKWLRYDDKNSKSMYYSFILNCEPWLSFKAKRIRLQSLFMIKSFAGYPDKLRGIDDLDVLVKQTSPIPPLPFTCVLLILCSTECKGASVSVNVEQIWRGNRYSRC